MFPQTNFPQVLIITGKSINQVLIITGKILPQVVYNYSSGRGKLLVPPPEAAFFRKSVSPLTEKQEVQEALKVLLVPYLSFVTISLNNNRTHS